MEGITINRRTLLTTVGAGSMLAVAGCSESEDGGSDGGSSGGEDGGSSENGSNATPENDSSSNDTGEAENDSEGEETQDVTQRGAGEDVLENAGLVIQEHEVVEEEYSTAVEGIVENTTDEVKDYVQVQVRAYDADGNQLDSYMDNTSDLQAGGTWAFSVPILDAEEMEEYDIAVTDSAL